MLSEEKEGKRLVNSEAIDPLRGVTKLAILSVRSMLPGSTAAPATILAHLCLFPSSLPRGWICGLYISQSTSLGLVYCLPELTNVIVLVGRI